MKNNCLKFFILFSAALLIFSGCGKSRNYISDAAGISSDIATIKGNIGVKEDSGSGSVKSKKTSSYGKGSSTGDAHYIEADDYFYSKEAFKSGWIYVRLGKMVQPATKQTKNEALFMDVIEGNEVWTKNYWSTRKAEKADIKMGAIVIIFDAPDGDIYVAPQRKQEARTGGWFMAKITDLSDLYQGAVMVSGGYKISVDNLRVKK